MALSLYEEANSMGTEFEGEDEDNLQGLVAAICHSKATSSSKSTYLSWIRYFDKGEGSCSRLVLEALLAY